MSKKLAKNIGWPFTAGMVKGNDEEEEEDKGFTAAAVLKQRDFVADKSEWGLDWTKGVLPGPFVGFRVKCLGFRVLAGTVSWHGGQVSVFLVSVRKSTHDSSFQRLLPPPGMDALIGDPDDPGSNRILNPKPLNVCSRRRDAERRPR
jgi:hypothetical protein